MLEASSPRELEAFQVEQEVREVDFHGHAKLTVFVFLTCLVAASGGILFGELSRVPSRILVHLLHCNTVTRRSLAGLLGSVICRAWQSLAEVCITACNMHSSVEQQAPLCCSKRYA